MGHKEKIQKLAQGVLDTLAGEDARNCPFCSEEEWSLGYWPEEVVEHKTDCIYLIAEELIKKSENCEEPVIK